jgi:phosphoketolase
VDDGIDPDVSVSSTYSLHSLIQSIFYTLASVIVGIGVEVTFEVVAAASLLRKLVPALRVRVVNVTDLMILGQSGSHPHSLSDADFETLFTKDRPVHFNYHGYPIELKGLLFGRPGLDRITIEGYVIKFTHFRISV